MANMSVNNKKAEKILERAFKEIEENNDWLPSSDQKSNIGRVILGTHKTYRYILTNGLLAKATNENINPLALQAGADLKGSFDARSLCHSVLVPFERDYLDSRLGASNEPFLNKPARFTTLSTDNPVRSGNDTRILNYSIKVLSSIKNSDDAYEKLKESLYYILKRPAKGLGVKKFKKISNFSIKVTELFGCLSVFSSEGEIPVLITGLCFEILNQLISEDLDIVIHPVNQSGASSKEISDIDIFIDNKLFYAVEVKDKVFTIHDVHHAVNKVKSSGNNSLIFVIGPNGKPKGDLNLAEIEKNAMRNGFKLSFVYLKHLYRSLSAICQELSLEDVITFIDEQAKKANFKDVTIEHVYKCLSKYEQV